MLGRLGLTFQQWSSELTSQLLVIVPDPENPIHRDISGLRAEIGRQADMLRSQEGLETGHPGRPLFAPAHSFDPTGPVSPRQQAFDLSRRPSLQPPPKPNTFRAPLPPHLAASPRRFGSFGGPTGPNGASSPSSMRPAPPSYALPPPVPGPSGPSHQAPQNQHLLAAGGGSPPTLVSLRRHTSADIRLQGWQGPGAPPPAAVGPNHGGSPYASGHNSSQWPSSPYRQAANPEDQQLRNALAQYELPRGNAHGGMRQVTPPPDQGGPPYGNAGNEGWQLPGPKFPFKGLDASAPPTRRSSMASNVHSLLNPSNVGERDGEDEGPEERKRKRIS